MSALLALSDVITLRALERAYSRGIGGDGRRIADREGVPRHQAYRRFPVPHSKLDHALTGSFDVLPELRSRWLLPIEADDWGVVLNHYLRGLLIDRNEHNLDDLEVALRTLGAGHAT